MSTGQTIGFIGLGRMGGQMSARLLAAGHKLSVYDVDAAATTRTGARSRVAVTTRSGGSAPAARS